jgi:hypothetical protein
VSYFSARVGKGAANDDRRTADNAGRPANDGRRTNDDRRPLFAARTGSRPTKHTQHATRNTQYPISDIQYLSCPLCRSPLSQENGLWRCQGRCGARWVEDGNSGLLDLAALPFGVCACCERPQALVRGDDGPVCPASGRRYLLLAGGAALPADAALHGLCQCCAPPSPLDGRLVCQAKPTHEYRCTAGGVTLVGSPNGSGTPTETLAAIDEALRRNNARVVINGLFEAE